MLQLEVRTSLGSRVDCTAKRAVRKISLKRSTLERSAYACPNLRHWQRASKSSQHFMNLSLILYGDYCFGSQWRTRTNRVSQSHSIMSKRIVSRGYTNLNVVPTTTYEIIRWILVRKVSWFQQLDVFLVTPCRRMTIAWTRPTSWPWPTSGASSSSSWPAWASPASSPFSSSSGSRAGWPATKTMWVRVRFPGLQIGLFRAGNLCCVI